MSADRKRCHRLLGDLMEMTNKAGDKATSDEHVTAMLDRIHLDFIEDSQKMASLEAELASVKAKLEQYRSLLREAINQLNVANDCSGLVPDIEEALKEDA